MQVHGVGATAFGFFAHLFFRLQRLSLEHGTTAALVKAKRPWRGVTSRWWRFLPMLEN
jgi:hypothetical protein